MDRGAPQSSRSGAAGFALLAAMLLAFVFAGGCSSQPAESAKPVAEAPRPEPKPEPAPEPPPKPDWTAKLVEAAETLAAAEDDEEKLAAVPELLQEIRDHEPELSDDERTQLAELEAELVELRQTLAEKRREAWLESAQTALADGDLESSARSLDLVFAATPTEEQKRRADVMKTKIEDIRRIRRELRTAMSFLEGTDKAKLRAARSRLLQDAEVALPLLMQSVESDNLVVAANALEILRHFNQPQRTLKAVLGVLSNPKQKEIWPEMVGLIGKFEHPGAGPELLKLLETSDDAQQRMIVLQALAVAHDPPPETLVTVLPLLYREDETLTPALEAAYRAGMIHRQTDLVARRGFNGALTAEQEQQLAKLPQRLMELAGVTGEPSPKGAEGDNGDKPAADENAGAEQADGANGANGSRLAALKLGIATRQIPPGVLKVAKLDRVSHDAPEHPAASVIDGQWNVTEASLLWRHPTNQRTLIVLDLGEVRTVAAVRIWNYNEAGGTHRGWKEFGVFVSETPSLRDSAVTALIPPAPGRPDVPDYGVTVPVPFVRGRYVKLEPYSMWRDDGIGGVTEIQVLGF